MKDRTEEYVLTLAIVCLAIVWFVFLATGCAVRRVPSCPYDSAYVDGCRVVCSADGCAANYSNGGLK